MRCKLNYTSYASLSAALAAAIHPAPDPLSLIPPFVSLRDQILEIHTIIILRARSIFISNNMAFSNRFEDT